MGALTLPRIKIYLQSLADSITGRVDIGMSYMQYDRDIRQAHRVQLEGWPENVKFATPSALGATVRTLHKALADGGCKWVKMRKAQVEELNRELEKLGPKARRAPRSDRGGSHKKRVRRGEGEVASDDSESEQSETEAAPKASKRARKPKSTSARQAKSREFVDSDEDE